MEIQKIQLFLSPIRMLFQATLSNALLQNKIWLAGHKDLPAEKKLLLHRLLQLSSQGLSTK